MSSRCRWVRAIAALVLIPSAVSANEPSPADMPAQLELIAPELVGEAPLLDAPPQSAPGRALLRLLLDGEGTVVEAAVEPEGEVELPAEVAKAALEAARALRFRPALRAGEPISARILFALDYAPVAPASLPEPMSAPSSIEEEAPLEVTALSLSTAEGLRRSAQAVKVIETEEARRQSADMGELLARQQGVAVRRSGGLGSGERLSLNGLSNDQIRFFLDGIPLDMAGYPFGVSNVPVNLVERVELFSGVVPVRLGADALGGAVNLVSERQGGTGLSASYEMGSFETRRLTLGGRYGHAPSGLFARVDGFSDTTENSYPVEVEIADEKGQVSQATVRRFHDGYEATGGGIEVGFRDRPWAKLVKTRLYLSSYDKEYQHGATMAVPYGGVVYGEQLLGGSVWYEQGLSARLSLEWVGAYSQARGRFLDTSDCVYGWYGQCIRKRGRPGEVASVPHDQVTIERTGFSRLNLRWQPTPSEALLLSNAVTLSTRTGDERRQSDPSARDPLTAERELMTLVSGLEFMHSPSERLEAVLFAKSYYQMLQSEEPRPGDLFLRRDRDALRGGVGAGVRYDLTEWLLAKGSYEWATRLPRPDEVFGDNAFIAANLGLAPETSHNLNLGAAAEAGTERLGTYRAQLTAFLRESSDLIVLLGEEQHQMYQNVYGARSTGLEAAAGWRSPGSLLSLDLNGTWQDLRNTSGDGTFGDFKGDRIPNQPYLFANGALSVCFADVIVRGDELSAGWGSRYQHSFYRGWQSLGLREYKQVIASQFTHSLSLGHVVRGERTSVSTNLELQNLTDEKVFDYFGIQRPGRAFFFKTTIEL